MNVRTVLRLLFIYKACGAQVDESTAQIESDAQVDESTAQIESDAEIESVENDEVTFDNFNFF